jgi:hypothetical protein
VRCTFWKSLLLMVEYLDLDLDPYCLSVGGLKEIGGLIVDLYLDLYLGLYFDPYCLWVVT